MQATTRLMGNAEAELPYAVTKKIKLPDSLLEKHPESPAIENSAEDPITLILGISRMLNEEWQMLAEYLCSDNDSSDSTFAYDGNQITLALMRIF